ncbi:MAG: type II toxin-antitoxin system Phd/YefM family antitoxin [Candidatus Aquicultorales bacterium]
MRTAAVGKLKASLSEYLNRVKSGEEILVTDRGTPIAKIIPVPKSYAPQHLQQLEKKGLLKIGEGKLPNDFWRLPRPKDPRGLGLKALLEEREEAD